MEKPLLFVDIDGVISLFGFPAERRPDGRFLSVEGIAHFLSAEAGPHLLALAAHYDLVWCSGWEEKANEHLPQALGLPGSLPFLTFERRPGLRAHWKVAAIDDHAGAARPLAWVDDTLDEDCEAWARERPGPTLLVRTEPHSGLTRTEAELLVTWARRLR